MAEAGVLEVVKNIFLDPALETNGAQSFDVTLGPPQRREVPLMADIDVGPAECNLHGVYRGDLFTKAFTFKEDGVAMDVSLWEPRAQVRRKRTGELVAEMAVNDIDAADGLVTIQLSTAQTRALSENVYVWDMQRTDEETTVLYGTLTPRGDVTRDA